MLVKMKEIFLRLLVVFFLFEVSLPLYSDTFAEMNIEYNEMETESESESEEELEKEKRKIKRDFIAINQSIQNVDNNTLCFDPFRILENEFFDLNDLPPEC